MNTGNLTTQDLIDLAIEYEMVRSTSDFQSRPGAIQNAIIKQIKKIADQNEG
ncbi:hypothetical protein [Xanthobacter sediminis]